PSSSALDSSQSGAKASCTARRGRVLQGKRDRWAKGDSDSRVPCLCPDLIPGLRQLVHSRWGKRTTYSLGKESDKSEITQMRPNPARPSSPTKSVLGCCLRLRIGGDTN